MSKVKQIKQVHWNSKFYSFFLFMTIDIILTEIDNTIIENLDNLVCIFTQNILSVLHNHLQKHQPKFEIQWIQKKSGC